MEQTLVILKPDTVIRGLVGELTTRLERKGLILIGSYMTQATAEQLEQHYCDLLKKVYYPDIVASMTLGPIVVQVWTGMNAIATVRMMIGATHPVDALPGTIRGDYCIDVGRNLIHASANDEDYQREANIWRVNLYQQHITPDTLRSTYRLDQSTYDESNMSVYFS
jgi:nucleoside-diphosphate kinase